MSDPVLPADDAARATAKATLAGARHGALGTLDADGAPQVTRVAVLADGPDVLILVSALSLHAAALAADPRASLLLGEPPPKGDPLAGPRLTLSCTARPEDKAALRPLWMAAHPRAALYYHFADFSMIRLSTARAFLNAGFGRAHRLTPRDLTTPPADA